MEVKEGNKIICEFMGGKGHDGVVTYYVGPDGFQHEGGSFLEYHCSWEWLMPVVEKIAKMELTYKNVEETYRPYPTTFGMIDEEGNFMVRLFCNQLFHAPTLLEATWLAVTDFLVWESREKVEQFTGDVSF